MPPNWSSFHIIKIIWSSKDCEDEALTQLDNNQYYELISLDPQTVLNDLSQTITNFIRTCLKNNMIHPWSTNIHIFNTREKSTFFYLLPKVHKPNTSGRPIISGCGSPTDRLSAFVDFYLRPIVESLPSYIKDTNNVLNKMFEIPTPITPSTSLATIDVKSLYTNIQLTKVSIWR